MSWIQDPFFTFYLFFYLTALFFLFIVFFWKKKHNEHHMIETHSIYENGALSFIYLEDRAVWYNNMTFIYTP